MKRVPPLRVFEALCEARALLFRCCEYEDSGEAIGPLLAYAHVHGLADRYGIEFVVLTINRVFGFEDA
jgi:hypothetical protein